MRVHGTSFPCRRFAMAPSATSTATHYRRVCFMKVVSNSSPVPHTHTHPLTLAAQKDSGHARTRQAPPSSIRRRSRRGRETSPCQSPFACHHSHHFRQRQMRRLALLSEAAFLLLFVLQLFNVPLLYDTFVSSPLPPLYSFFSSFSCCIALSSCSSDIFSKSNISLVRQTRNLFLLYKVLIGQLSVRQRGAGEGWVEGVGLVLTG